MALIAGQAGFFLLALLPLSFGRASLPLSVGAWLQSGRGCAFLAVIADAFQEIGICGKGSRRNKN